MPYNSKNYNIRLKKRFPSRDREARAAKLAREIEGTSSSHLAAELENGDEDEEAVFSAVQRGPSQSKTTKYIISNFLVHLVTKWHSIDKTIVNIAFNPIQLKVKF